MWLLWTERHRWILATVGMLLVLGLDDVQPKVFDCQKYQAGLDPGKKVPH